MKRIKEKHVTPPSFYTELPISQISQSDLVLLLQKRLKILRMVEDGVKDQNLLNMPKEEDSVSHFVCRLVCSQVEWVYKWWVNAETKYFRFRLGSIGDLEEYFSNYTFKDASVVDSCLYIHRDSSLIVNLHNKVSIPIYKKIYVHFTKVSEVFSRRLVDLKDGYCELSHIDVLLSNEFKNRLKGCPKGDTRLLRLCKEQFQIQKASTLGEYNSEDKKFYPPCITSILEHFTLKRHIKYNDRQALTLFLKDCGMSLEECEKLFLSLFNIPKGEFDKQYLYNLRHNYGLEGKKATYTCFSCQKMAYNRNSVNLSGCPFVDNKNYVEKYGKEKGVDIEDLFKEGTPVKRCTSLLERLTGEEYDKTVTTPIKYFVTYKKNGGTNK